MPLSMLKNLTTQQKADWERYYAEAKKDADPEYAAKIAWVRFKKKYKRSKGGGWELR